MASSLAHKNVVLGITGSIAAYKSADVVRRLREAYADVRVVMTENAKRFITPLTLQAVSGHPVHDDLFDPAAEAAMGHIELARWADVILVAPASADFMARLAVGEAPDLLTTLALASRAPIVLAPAMNQGMWRHALTQKNLQHLSMQGISIVGPGEGSQACGDVGPGRMVEPVLIMEAVKKIFASGLLSGVKVMLTAGPTQEAIDPVRYISNASSGKMGYALARALKEAGASVRLVSGPVHLAKPEGVQVVSVISALEMQDAVMQSLSDCDIFISVAAVSDYRVKDQVKQKIKKHKDLKLELVLNPDIVATVAKMQNRPRLVIGFAAETENVLAAAKQKLADKALDLIIANDVSKQQGIGADKNAVVVISKHREIFFPETSKEKLARELTAVIANEYKSKLS